LEFMGSGASPWGLAGLAYTIGKPAEPAQHSRQRSGWGFSLLLFDCAPEWA
jgi:hypothetical protein